MIAHPSPHRGLPARTEPSPRQREVWRLICQGQGIKGIMEAMGVSKSTVKKHREALYAKLGAHCVADVVLAGVRDGVVTVEGRA